MTDADLIEADLALPLGLPPSTDTEGTGVLLTGATGFLGAFLLRELLSGTDRTVYCLVRSATAAAGMARLRAAAAKHGLPEPDPLRVRAVPGDLRDVTTACRRYRDGELAGQVGSVLHCAAAVAFTEPYRTLRADNVLPVAELVRWQRAHGIRDFGFVSTLSAATPVAGRLLENRWQQADPSQDGYGVSKWVAERLLDGLDADGMRIRVFRPGLVLASERTGACGGKDLIWSLLASGLAVGAYPMDERGMPVSGVDSVAAAIGALATEPDSAGHVYHLADTKTLSVARMFELLAEAGLPARPVSPADWLRLVAERATTTNNTILARTALYEVGGAGLAEDAVQADGWQPVLRRHGLDPAPTGALLRAGLTHLADRQAEFGALLGHLLSTDRTAAVR